MVEKTDSGNLWPSLQEPFQRLGSRLAEWLAPASEAAAEENAYRIAMELPGVEESDIDLTVHDGVVRVKGEKRSSHEEKGETWFFSERQFGAFSRSFRLPPDADDDAISADLKDGVLTIVVPKRTEPEKSAKSVRIKKG